MTKNMIIGDYEYNIMRMSAHDISGVIEMSPEQYQKYVDDRGRFAILHTEYSFADTLLQAEYTCRALLEMKMTETNLAAGFLRTLYRFLDAGHYSRPSDTKPTIHRVTTLLARVSKYSDTKFVSRVSSSTSLLPEMLQRLHYTINLTDTTLRALCMYARSIPGYEEPMIVVIKRAAKLLRGKDRPDNFGDAATYFVRAIDVLDLLDQAPKLDRYVGVLRDILKLSALIPITGLAEIPAKIIKKISAVPPVHVDIPSKHPLAGPVSEFLTRVSRLRSIVGRIEFEFGKHAAVLQLMNTRLLVLLRGRN